MPGKFKASEQLRIYLVTLDMKPDLLISEDNNDEIWLFF